MHAIDLTFREERMENRRWMVLFSVLFLMVSLSVFVFTGLQQKFVEHQVERDSMVTIHDASRPPFWFFKQQEDRTAKRFIRFSKSPPLVVNKATDGKANGRTADSTQKMSKAEPPDKVLSSIRARESDDQTDPTSS